MPIAGRPPSLIKRPSGCYFHPRCPYVQPDHKRIDPRLEGLPGAPEHKVACLLTSEQRTGIWRGIGEGRDARGTAAACREWRGHGDRERFRADAGAKPMSASTEPLIELRNVKKYFPIKQGILFTSAVGAVKAVDDVSLRSASGRDARDRR